jgi:hypothetical protein
MRNIESVTAMLADHVVKKESYRPSGNIREQQLVDHLYKILDNVWTSSPYEMENENILNLVSRRETNYDSLAHPQYRLWMFKIVNRIELHGQVK